MITPMVERRIIDGAVAKVMGWTDVAIDAYTPYGKDVCGTPPDGVKPMWNTGRSAVPNFSTDIAAAMRVVEYFTNNGECTHHFEMIYFAGEGTWCVEIGGRECGNPSRPFRLPQELWSESLPLAICHAALSAVGVPEITKLLQADAPKSTWTDDEIAWMRK